MVFYYHMHIVKIKAIYMQNGLINEVITLFIGPYNILCKKYIKLLLLPALAGYN